MCNIVFKFIVIFHKTTPLIEIHSSIIPYFITSWGSVGKYIEGGQFFFEQVLFSTYI